MNNEVGKVALALPGHITAVSLELPSGLKYKDWEVTGKRLTQFRQACHWWVGDWLNFGEAQYGEMYSQALEETQYAYATLAKDKFVASRFEFLRRRKNLSWSHHEVVASLEPSEQDRWLDQAEKHHWTREELREEIRAFKAKRSADAATSPTTAGVAQGTQAENVESDEAHDKPLLIEPGKWAVLIECDNQVEMRNLIEQFTAQGLRCREYRRT